MTGAWRSWFYFLCGFVVAQALSTWQLWLLRRRARRRPPPPEKRIVRRLERLVEDCEDCEVDFVPVERVAMILNGDFK